jgi:hypothetical protein
MGQGERLGRAPQELLELEVEAEITMIDRQPVNRCAGQGLGRARQAAKNSGRTLGGECRIARQELVGAVAPQHHFDLFPRKAAQEMSRQNGRVAERLIEPAGHFR